MRKNILISSGQNNLTRPLYASRVPAGFPSPADDYIEKPLDLNEYLVKNPAATFYVRVTGDSMIGAGIYPDDIIIVDRSLNPRKNSIVLAVIDGEMTVKRFIEKNRIIYLYPENGNYEPIRITEEMNFEIWGIVSFVLHKVN